MAAPPRVLDSSRLRLRARLLILLAIALAPAGILAVIQAVRAYSIQLAGLEASLAQTARLAANEHENIVAAGRDILRSLSTQAEVLGPEAGACNEALARTISGLPQYTGLVRVDEAGRVVCAWAPDVIGVDLSDRDWFRDIEAGSAFVVSNLLTSRIADSTRGIVIARGLVGEAGQPAGAVSMLVDLGRLAAQYVGTKLPEGSAFALLDSAGATLSELSEGLPPLIVPSIEMGAGGPRVRPGVFRAAGIDGVRRIYVVEPLLEERLYVLLGVPTAAALNPLTWQAAQVILLPVLMWLLAAAVIWFGLERLVIRWLRYLERITSLYAQGRRGVRPERIVSAPVEIRSLGETFSRMADLIDAHETELKESLAQKDMLVREVHHRVKNNLQLVMSLLSLHGRRVRDPRAELAFIEVRERITALATLHRRLYESETLDSVDLKWFIEDLCAELRKGGLPGAGTVRLLTDLPSMEFPASGAVPLGLLVTEAISNAYKHAFASRGQGVIRVTARQVDREMIVTVSDDGLGEPGPSEVAEGGLGRSLMESFARQLGGSLSIEAGAEGTCVTVRFPNERETAAPAPA